MNELITQLTRYLQFPFVRYALAAGVLIAFSAAMLGVPLVLKRYSLIGDGLSHVAFGAMCVSSILNLFSDMALVLPVTILSAILLLRSGGKAKLKGDAALAMLSVSSMAIGYLLINRFSSAANISGDVCSTLFGSTSILTLTPLKVWLCIGMSFGVLLVFLVFYRQIFAVTFDEAFARASGLRVGAYNTLLAVVTAVIVVLSMTLVGSLLTSALIVFPSLSAMRLFGSFKSVVIFSAGISVVSAFLGMIIAILVGTPVGSTIVLAELAAYLICSLIAKLRKGA